MVVSLSYLPEHIATASALETLLARRWTMACESLSVLWPSLVIQNVHITCTVFPGLCSIHRWNNTRIARTRNKGKSGDGDTLSPSPFSTRKIRMARATNQSEGRLLDIAALRGNPTECGNVGRYAVRTNSLGSAVISVVSLIFARVRTRWRACAGTSGSKQIKTKFDGSSTARWDVYADLFV